MDPFEEVEVRAAVAELGVRRLQAAYGDAVTRQAWDEVVGLFVPDCPIHLDLRDGTERTVVGGAGLVELVAGAVARFEFFEFTILNAVVEVVSSSEATGRMYLCELRQDAPRGRWTTAYGRYRDRYVRTPEGWRFAERRYASLARSAPDGDGMEVFPVPRD